MNKNDLGLICETCGKDIKTEGEYLLHTDHKIVPKQETREERAERLFVSLFMKSNEVK